MGFVSIPLLFLLFVSLSHAAVGVPLVNSATVLSSSSFSVDISGSTKGSGQVYQAVSVVRSGSTVYDQVPALSFSTSRTSVTFTSAHLEPQDVIYHTYYTAATGGSVITYAAAVYQGKCLRTPSNALPAWSGTDYTTYPFDLGGLGGTTATVYANVSSYIGAGYTINTYSGCWSANALVPGTSATPLSDVSITYPSTYMIFTSNSDATTNVTSIPLQPYVQSTHQASAVDIDWGDGTIQHGLTSSTGVTRTHTYGANGVHTIRIAGTAHALCYTALAGTSASGLLVDIQQWGTVVTYQLNVYDELRTGSVVVSATDAPNPSLVNVDRLFGTAVTPTTLAPYASRITSSLSTWALPALVTANDAFPGLNLSTATAAAGGLLPSTLTSTNGMFLRSVLPSAVTFAGASLSSSTSMFLGASVPGTFNVTGVASSASTAMFQGATFGGAVTFASSSFASPVGAFGTTPQSTFTYFQSTVTFSNTTMTGDATSLFINAKFQSATTATSFAGLDVTGVTTATTMFANAAFTLTPNMDTLDLRGAITLGTTAFNGAFAMVSKLPNLPALDLRSATACTGAFASAVFVNRFVPSWPSFKCTTATGMFKSTVFMAGADMSGVNVSQVVTATSMFQTAQFEVDNVSPGAFSACTNAQNLYASAFCRTTPCATWNMSALSLPVATTVSGALSIGAAYIGSGGPRPTSVSNVPALDLSAATTCTYLFASTGLTFAEQFVPSWPSMKCTTATSFFEGAQFALGSDLTGMNTSQVVTATNFFQSSTADPDVSTWDLNAVTSANNFLNQCYVSTPARYSQVLIAFSARSTLNGATMGSPYNTTTGTTLQGYDSSGATARADLVSRSWTLNDGGLM